MSTKEQRPSGVAAPAGAGSKDTAASVSSPTNTARESAEQATNALPRIACAGKLFEDPQCCEWLVKVGDEIVVVTIPELESFQEFNRCCMAQLGRRFATIKPERWAGIVDDAMRERQS
jgi:hypothetical protein